MVSLRLWLSLTLLLLTMVAAAQPELPNINGSNQNTMALLSWTCQYDGIKYITVQRSADSVKGYTTIGNVERVQKGVQHFADGHPMPGDNWYRLQIVFMNSNAPWTSNRVKIHVDSATVMLQQWVIPPNDELQHMVTMSAGKTDTLDKMVSDITHYYDSLRVAAQNKSKLDSLLRRKPKIKLNLTDNGGEFDPYVYLKSPYVYTDPVSGHVQVALPDVTLHIYELRFYNKKGKTVLEVPQLHTSPVLIDKRNFQEKGIYRFNVYKNNTLFDSGFISIY